MKTSQGLRSIHLPAQAACLGDMMLACNDLPGRSAHCSREGPDTEHLFRAVTMTHGSWPSVPLRQCKAQCSLLTALFVTPSCACLPKLMSVPGVMLRETDRLSRDTSS